MKQNEFLLHGGFEATLTGEKVSNLPYWDAAEQDVKCAIFVAAEILGDNDCIDIRKYMDGAEKGQAVISIANLILAQQRFYISGCK
jgi:hypothetical protein